MSLDWKQWEGQVIDGKFPLVRYLGGSEYSAVFLTELHHSEGSQKAAIKLVPASGAHDDVQLSRWGGRPSWCILTCWRFLTEGAARLAARRTFTW